MASGVGALRSAAGFRVAPFWVKRARKSLPEPDFGNQADRGRRAPRQLFSTLCGGRFERLRSAVKPRSPEYVCEPAAGWPASQFATCYHKLFSNQYLHLLPIATPRGTLLTPPNMGTCKELARDSHAAFFPQLIHSEKNSVRACGTPKYCSRRTSIRLPKPPHRTPGSPA